MGCEIIFSVLLTQVVHDFERGTGISSIMNMFGGSGRISCSGKFRTSFPASSADDMPAESHREARRRSEGGVAGMDGNSFSHSNNGYYHSNKPPNAPKVASHRHSTGGVGTLSLKSVSADEYGGGFRSAGHTPTKPSAALHSPIALDDTHLTRDSRLSGSIFSSSSASITSATDLPETLDTLETLETASTDCTTGVEAGVLERTQSDSVLFTQSEIMGLRLMFSLFDRLVFLCCGVFYSHLCDRSVCRLQVWVEQDRLRRLGGLRRGNRYVRVLMRRSIHKHSST